MRSYRWIGFIASRYVFKGRSNRTVHSSILAVLGILVGCLALTVILAVMNGFQLGFIESIVEISSYHIRVEHVPPGEQADALLERIRELPLVKAAVPFREFQGIVRGRRDEQQIALVRGLPPDALAQDSGMKAQLDFESGQFDLSAGNAIIIGAELARRLSMRVGDDLTLVSLSGLFPAAAVSGDFTFVVTGIFRSGFYEYDLSWALVNLDTAESIMGAGESLSLGIKTQNRWQDMRGIEQISRDSQAESLLTEMGIGGLSSWRDYNRAFYAALRTEKFLIFILVGLIFIVVGLNIFQAQRRAVLERREEIGLFRAIGASDLAVRLVFVWDGFIIGMAGAGFGTLLGLLIAGHIKSFFSFLEVSVNAVIGLLNLVQELLGFSGSNNEFSIFSPTIFYIKGIPSRIIPREIALVFLFGFLSALCAAWFASRSAAKTIPAEVLRDE